MQNIKQIMYHAANLQLSLKTQWFEMTKAGIKTEDYREINGYWLKRLTTYSNKMLYLDILDEIIELNKGSQLSSCFQFKQFNYNIMTLDYPKSTDTSRILKLEHKGIEIGYGRSEWGAEPNKLYFVIKHGKILTTPQIK